MSIASTCPPQSPRQGLPPIGRDGISTSRAKGSAPAQRRPRFVSWRGRQSASKFGGGAESTRTTFAFCFVAAVGAVGNRTRLSPRRTITSSDLLDKASTIDWRELDCRCDSKDRPRPSPDAAKDSRGVAARRSGSEKIAFVRQTLQRAQKTFDSEMPHTSIRASRADREDILHVHRSFLNNRGLLGKPSLFLFALRVRVTPLWFSH